MYICICSYEISKNRNASKSIGSFSEHAFCALRTICDLKAMQCFSLTVLDVFNLNNFVAKFTQSVVHLHRSNTPAQLKKMSVSLNSPAYIKRFALRIQISFYYQLLGESRKK